MVQKKTLEERLLLSMSGDEAQALVRQASDPLLSWYRENARDLPWRHKATAYRVWISEVMLQQTRVEAVKPYYARFLEAFPDLPALARAEEERLLKCWEGLGYYSRARNLQKAARQVMEQFGGELPASYEALLSLPGFGEYTAGAVASIAYGIRVPAVDGNGIRVFSRLLASEADGMNAGVRKSYRELLLSVMPPEEPGTYNQAVMELGATLCGPGGAPRCGECPLNALCRGYQDGNPTAFPVKAPKKPRRIEERTIFLLVCPNGVILQKRPKGLLGGLWEFPGEEGRLSFKEQGALLKERGIEYETLSLLPEAKHIFSHVEWHMTGCLAVCSNVPPKEGQVLARWEELESRYPLPGAFSAYRRVLEEKRKDEEDGRSIFK